MAQKVVPGINFSWRLVISRRWESFSYIIDIFHLLIFSGQTIFVYREVGTLNQRQTEVHRTSMTNEKS